MGGGGSVTINGVKGGQGREDTTINWWRTQQIPTYFESWKVLQSVLLFQSNRKNRLNSTTTPMPNQNQQRKKKNQIPTNE
jgi:hypothetical protein